MLNVRAPYDPRPALAARTTAGRVPSTRPLALPQRSSPASQQPQGPAGCLCGGPTDLRYTAGPSQSWRQPALEPAEDNGGASAEHCERAGTAAHKASGRTSSMPRLSDGLRGPCFDNESHASASRPMRWRMFQISTCRGRRERCMRMQRKRTDAKCAWRLCAADQRTDTSLRVAELQQVAARCRHTGNG